MPRMGMKVCAACKMEQPFAHFSKSKGQSDGLFAWCKDCSKIKRREYQERNKEAIKVRRQAAYQANADARREEALKRYHRNSAVISERRKMRRLGNLEERRATEREYYHLNRPRCLEAARAYRERNPDRVRESNIRSKRKNPDRVKRNRQQWYARNRLKKREYKVRRRARLYGVEREPVDRLAIIQRDNSTCYLCGAYLARHEVTLDHVIPLARGGAHKADNLRVACRPCNSAKKDAALEDFLRIRS